MALWESGSTDKAISVARKAAEVDSKLGNVVAGLTLVAKMVYQKFGPSYALGEVRNASVEALSDARYFLTALAVAVVSGDESAISSLLASHSSSFPNEILIQAHLLVADSKQVRDKVISFLPSISCPVISNKMLSEGRLKLDFHEPMA